MVENSKNLISSNRLFPDMTENLCLKEKPVCKYHGGTYIHIYYFILMISRIFKRKKLHKFFNRYFDLKNFFFWFILAEHWKWLLLFCPTFYFSCKKLIKSIHLFTLKTNPTPWQSKGNWYILISRTSYVKKY